MKIRTRFAAPLLMAVLICSPAVSAQDDEIIAQGDPPLTASMAGKFVGLIQWCLEVRLTQQQTGRVVAALTDAWRSGDRATIKGVADSANIADSLARASEADRNRAKGIFRERVLNAMERSPGDPLNRIFLEVYNSARQRSSPNAEAEGQSSMRTNGANKLRVGEDALSGIYVGLYNPPPGAALNSVQTAFVTFLPDGHVYWMLPPEGLLRFDPTIAARAYPDDWGTYTVSGNEIRVTLGPGLRRSFVRDGSKLKLMKYDGQNRASTEYTFTRLATGDGLKLQGTYRRWAGDPAITFAADGTFRDDGFTRHFGTIGRADGTLYQGDGRGGTGTYLIEQNTLELRYKDGRTIRFAFTGLPEQLTSKPIRSFRINHEIFKLD